MKTLKVIQIIDSLNVGGAEMLAVNIANGLLDKNVASHICVTRKEGVLKKNIDKEVGYLFLQRKYTFDISAIFRLKKYIKKYDIQIIHAHSTSSFIAFCVKIIYPKVKIVWHNHSGAYLNLGGVKLKVLKFISIYFYYIISVNSNLESWSKKILQHKKGSYLPNFPSFTNYQKRTKLEGENKKKIICLAGLRNEKDHLNLLKAFRVVVEKYSDWSLHLVGKDYANAYALSIKEYIKESNLAKNVFLYGVCSDIKHILSQATIGVLSSKSEGLPLSLLEYGLAKLPVLVTNVGECSEVVKNKEAMVSPERSDEFSKTLLFLIENEDVREKVAVNLHKNVVENFSQKSAINQLIKIYRGSK